MRPVGTCKYLHLAYETNRSQEQSKSHTITSRSISLKRIPAHSVDQSILNHQNEKMDDARVPSAVSSSSGTKVSLPSHLSSRSPSPADGLTISFPTYPTNTPLKVTSDPSAPTKTENPGTVTSDSLAGESISSGGSFAADSSARGVSKQPSSSTTTNTTDTSGATELPASTSAAVRGEEVSGGAGGSGGTDYPAAFSAGSTTGGGYTGGNGERSDLSGNTGSTSSGGRQTGSSGSDTTSGPKGDNIQEGGFDSSAPNASFTTDIGGENDPGRAALQGMQKRDAQAAGGGVAGGRSGGGVSGRQGQFDGVEETEA